MKLLSATEIKSIKEAELKRDVIRTEGVRDTLNKTVAELNDVNDKFELALANQQKRWAKEESEAISRMDALNREVEELEAKRKEAGIPIANLEKKAHTLFNAAEAVLKDAKEKQKQVDEKRQYIDDLGEKLQLKMDSLSEKEQDLEERMQRLVIREEAIASERDQIKKLSKELSTQLSKL